MLIIRLMPALACGRISLHFTDTGRRRMVRVMQACMDLARLTWSPLQSCTLTHGFIYFSDPEWTNYPARFYRIRSP